MVLIPNDVGVRMRTQSETLPHPIAPVTEIPADLAELRPGQAFSARIQEVLPENTYKALVAGRSLTLALPEGAKAGDTLELVVVDRTPRLIVAQLANRGAPGDAVAAGDAHAPSLSPAARLIGALLARDGAPPPPAALTRGQALIAAPLNAAAMAAELAPQLARAVSQSGLFYEAHQVQWVMGQRPLAELLAEPQAKHSTASIFLREEAGAQTKSLAAGGRQAEASGAMVLLRNLFGAEEARVASGTATPAAPDPARVVPEELRPLVQQQLDAAATQRLAWHGEVWPGQTINWQIEAEDPRGDAEQAETGRAWITSLRLVTPRLGEIDARLNLTPQGIAIQITTPAGSTAADLQSALPALEKSMAAAGVPLLALRIKHGDQE